MQIHSLTCFGAAPGLGNLAYVIEDGPVAAPERLAFAAAQPASACAFLTPLDAGAFEVDYVYPHARSPLCLHASLAVARVLLRRQPQVRLRTALGGQWLAVREDGEEIAIGLQAQAAPTPVLAPELLPGLLRMPELPLASAPAVASVGSPKLLVELRDVASLRGLTPDLSAIVAWGKTVGVNGIYAWCRRSDGAFEGRNFNHLDPAREDSATGVAAGALAVHLATDILLYQGEGECRLRARRDGDQIWVGGRAEPAFQAQP